MPELNEDFDFDSASEEVRRAFRGSPSKELLEPPSKMYKWTQHSFLGRRGITPWWSLVDALELKNGATTPGLRTLQERGARLGVHERHFARVRSAVTKEWNTMQKPLFVQLLQPVWGWIGQASGQRASMDNVNVILIGGNYQAWIPNLTELYVKQISALPYLQPR